MSEYFFTEQDPVGLFYDISLTECGTSKLEDQIADSHDQLKPLSSAEMDVLNPRASFFQKTFERLGVTPKLKVTDYMRIILIGDTAYDMYENATKQGAELDGQDRFEDSNTGITGKENMLRELEHDLEFSSRKEKFRPWIVVSQDSYEPEVKELCEKYKE